MSGDDRPNILFIMSDDHAAHAIGCYGSRINETPNMDRIAEEGVRFDNCFCTNSICTPSRATILTGKHSHMNGVLTLRSDFNRDQQHVGKLLQRAGYETAVIGKWHLHTQPSGFDYYNVLPGQGLYHDPLLKEKGKEWQDHNRGGERYEGYVTDLITDLSLDWIRNRDDGRPFFLCCHHKAPHRHWEPDGKHALMYEDEEIPRPETFDDDYRNRASAAVRARMRVERDLNEDDLKRDPPEGLSGWDLKNWKYQRYIKDYLRCIASVDDNVGRMLDYLEETDLLDETVVIYTSDQGFFLGDHGWFDKRFMYEESLRMPFIVRYPREIESGTVNDDIALNLDFAETFLDYAGAEVPADMQGRSLRPLFRGQTPDDWRDHMYYRYWMHLSHHHVCAHYGLRTRRYKLIYYYGEALGAEGAVDEPTEPEWELFDLERDPLEMNSVYDDTGYSEVLGELKGKLKRAKDEARDTR
jgi:arylsulfatase A-like enzyme